MASSISSAAALVEAGVQEDIGDACSICLENFSDEEPSTSTKCGHEYHLQCILEWAQRSSECPLCWQPLGLQDPGAAELLAGIEADRTVFRPASAPATLWYRHSAQGDAGFDLSENAELERRIMEHLAAAAAGINRSRLILGAPSRRDGRPGHHHHHQGSSPDGQNRSSSGGGHRRHSYGGPGSSSQSHEVRQVHSPPSTATRARSPNIPIRVQGSSQASVSPSHGTTGDNSPSPDTLRARLAAASTRYREGLSKTTRGIRWLMTALTGDSSPRTPSPARASPDTSLSPAPSSAHHSPSAVPHPTQTSGGAPGASPVSRSFEAIISDRVEELGASGSSTDLAEQLRNLGSSNGSQSTGLRPAAREPPRHPEALAPGTPPLQSQSLPLDPRPSPAPATSSQDSSAGPASRSHPANSLVAVPPIASPSGASSSGRRAGGGEGARAGALAMELNKQEGRAGIGAGTSGDAQALTGAGPEADSGAGDKLAKMKSLRWSDLGGAAAGVPGEERLQAVLPEGRTSP